MINAVLIARAVSCWQLHQLISQTTKYMDRWPSDLLQSELQMKSLKVEGGGIVPQCPIAGDATVRVEVRDAQSTKSLGTNRLGYEMSGSPGFLTYTIIYSR